jgi:hypothetical protein
MSDTPQPGGAPASPTTGTTGPSDFQRYQAGGAGPGVVFGWAMPPSYMPLPPGPGFPGMPPAPAPAASGAALAGNVGQSLGTTVKLGLDMVNMLLSSTMNALAGAAALSQSYAPPGLGEAWHGQHGHGCGCGGHDCCEPMGCSGCQPRVSGCC